jgi:TPP-dependent pyruvate/acetoin dehydrogenase alpha subunit
LDDARVEAIRLEVEAAVAAALRFAEESPEPPPEALQADIYGQG